MGAWGRHSSGPASGLVRLELCCVLTFWFFWVKPKERRELLNTQLAKEIPVLSCAASGEAALSQSFYLKVLVKSKAHDILEISIRLLPYYQ